ncbi:MAG TPA: ABC transporter permease subunit [Thermomicrobiales bacterium]|nr:ABC transporter permease subunit [Thermomicrobiales bacterium]
MSADRPTQPYGEVYDLGYRHYEGERQGRAHAVRALIIYSMKRGLGIRKRWTSKIIPALLYAAAYAPALIVAGILAFLPDQVDFGYGDLAGFISTALLIFAAGLAPEMLSDDRRENVLALYFSRAITRADYLLAKVAAMGILMATIAFGPMLLLFIARVLLADSPISYFGDHVGDLGRIAAWGAIVCVYYTAIGLAIAALVDRKGIASAVFIGGIFLVAAVANALFQATSGTLRDYLVLISPLDLIDAITEWILGGATGDMANLKGPVYLVGVAAVIVVAALIMYRRYLAEE